MSDSFFRIDFEVARAPILEEDEGEEQKCDKVLVERTNVRVEILKVNETMVCIDFARKTGSSLLFYENFSFFGRVLTDLFDATYEE